MHCSCKFTSNNIIDEIFSCQGSHGQFKNTVVYRGKISLQVPASVTDAHDIVAIINQWVQSNPVVTVNGVTLEIDSGCPALLDSFDSNDCVTEAPPDQTSTSSSSSPLPFGIIIGVSVVVVVIILLIIIVIIIVVYRRKKKSTYRY